MENKVKNSIVYVFECGHTYAFNTVSNSSGQFGRKRRCGFFSLSFSAAKLNRLFRELSKSTVLFPFTINFKRRSIVFTFNQHFTRRKCLLSICQMKLFVDLFFLRKSLAIVSRNHFANGICCYWLRMSFSTGDTSKRNRKCVRSEISQIKQMTAFF